MRLGYYWNEVIVT